MDTVKIWGKFTNGLGVAVKAVRECAIPMTLVGALAVSACSSPVREIPRPAREGNTGQQFPGAPLAGKGTIRTANITFDEKNIMRWEGVDKDILPGDDIFEPSPQTCYDAFNRTSSLPAIFLGAVAGGLLAKIVGVNVAAGAAVGGAGAGAAAEFKELSQQDAVDLWQIQCREAERERSKIRFFEQRYPHWDLTRRGQNPAMRGFEEDRGMHRPSAPKVVRPKQPVRPTPAPKYIYLGS